MSKRIKVEGKTYVVPDDATDDEITELVDGQKPSVTGQPTGARLYNKGEGPEGEGPIRHWFSDLAQDVRTGGQATLPGRVLHGMGATGTESGAGGGPGGVGEFVGGPAIGPAVMGHGIANIPEHPIKGINETVRGLAQTAAPVVGAMVPGAVPNAVEYGGLGFGVRKGAEAFGADPDTAELAGNVGALAAPKGVPMTGRFLERNAVPIGKAAGIGAGIYEASQGKPWWLLAGTSPATRIASDVTRGIGRGLQQVVPVGSGIPGPVASPEYISPRSTPMVRRALSARHAAVEQPASSIPTPLALPPARSIQLGPSELGPVAAGPAESTVDMVTRGAPSTEAEQAEISRRVLENKRARVENAHQNPESSTGEFVRARTDLRNYESPVDVGERPPEDVEALKTRKAGVPRAPVAYPPEAPQVIEPRVSPKAKAEALETKSIQEQMRDAAELEDRTRLSQNKREWFARNAPAQGKGGLVESARANLGAKPAVEPPAGTSVPQTEEEMRALLEQMLRQTKKGKR